MFYGTTQREKDDLLILSPFDAFMSTHRHHSLYPLVFYFHCSFFCYHNLLFIFNRRRIYDPQFKASINDMFFYEKRERQL